MGGTKWRRIGPDFPDVLAGEPPGGGDRDRALGKSATFVLGSGVVGEYHWCLTEVCFDSWGSGMRAVLAISRWKSNRSASSVGVVPVVETHVSLNTVGRC